MSRGWINRKSLRGWLSTVLFQEVFSQTQYITAGLFSRLPWHQLLEIVIPLSVLIVCQSTKRRKFFRPPRMRPFGSARSSHELERSPQGREISEEVMQFYTRASTIKWITPHTHTHRLTRVYVASRSKPGNPTGAPFCGILFVIHVISFFFINPWHGYM